MSLINDNLDMIKASILVAIKNELVDTYPSEFGDYTSSNGDTRTKVYWADTVRFQPKYPYCVLTPQKDISEGFDEVSYVRSASGVLLKRVVTRSFMTVTISVFDMGNELTGKTGLEADTFAHKVARQLRKYFNGDGKLDWFSGNKYYPRQIGITVDTDINSVLDWADTDTFFVYSFDIRIGWDDIQENEVELANGAEISIYEDTKKIDEFNIKFIHKKEKNKNGSTR